MLDPHGMDPQTVLRFVKYVGGWPGRVFVVACEPEVVEDVGFGLSDAGQRRARSARPTSCSRRWPSCRGRRGMHELSVATAVLNTALKHADDRPVTLVSVRVGRLRQVVPDSLEFYFEIVARDTRLRGGEARARSRSTRVCAAADCEHEWSPEIPAFRCPRCASGERRRRGWRGARGRLHRGRGGGRMHRTKVRVVEDALDANNTIARANRDDFDRHQRHRREPDERARRGQDDAARAGPGPSRSAGLRVGVLEGDVQGSIDADRLATPAHPGDPAQHRQSGFGGECHLDANMVRSALPALPLRRARPARHRERRQPRLPGRVPGRRGRAGDGLLGDRGRGQAAQVPADVPRLRAGRRSTRSTCCPTSTSTSTSCCTTSSRSTRASSACSSAPAPARAWTACASGSSSWRAARVTAVV